MKVLRSESEFPGGASVVALGMFDGVHIGHQRLIRRAVALAREIGAASIVCTFDRHPLSVLFPERAPEPLLSLKDNLDKFERLGADFALVKPFTREFASVEPEAYIELLVRQLRAEIVVVGENYTFGRGGRGDAQLIRGLAEKYGYRAEIVEPVMDDGGMVSSTRIRSLLREGRTSLAQKLLDIQET